MGDGLIAKRLGERVSRFPLLALPSSRWAEASTGRRWLSSLPFHLLLFSLTVVTTLVVGARMAVNYAHDLPSFDWDFSRVFFADLLHNPSHLAWGIPFSFTLLGILLAHELGHYLTCRYYGIRASYPYFVPAPTLIGTLGAFIRIRSPILNRRALFDVGISGPLAGFALAVPALWLAVLRSHAVPVSDYPGTITFGSPPALVLLAHLLRPTVNPAVISLDPVGCAAWVGLFATALNLLPAGQLDGGHILYALLGEKHKVVSRGLLLVLLSLGVFFWAGWIVWGALLLILGLRHPIVAVPSEPLGSGRKVLALIAALVLILCFVPTPLSIH
jgi:membrane-associated protease RseP (regulator of RpoE activity)